MSIGHRNFVFEEDGSISRLSKERMDKLYSWEEECLPERGGQTVRILSVLYEVENRKPGKFVDCFACKIKFTEDGLVDDELRLRGLEECAFALDIGYPKGASERDGDDTVIDLSRELRIKQNNALTRRKPTAAQLKQAFDMVWKS